MVVERQSPTATLLQTGEVLVTGGDGYYQQNGSSCERYDPRRGTWSSTGSLLTGRMGHTATLLPSGKVLVVGGQAWSYRGWQAIETAELYDPATGAWTATGGLATRRGYHTATLLPSGKVLVAGGYDYQYDYTGAAVITYLAVTEIYDPATGTWTAAGLLATPRACHTATALGTGKVLIAGGNPGTGALASAELFDPATGVWSVTGSLATARQDHVAALLPNGKILVASGLAGDPANQGSYLSSAELFDPSLGTWSPTGSLWQPRWMATATGLDSGKLLVAGGQYWDNTASNFVYLRTAELY
jgi:N-acetylneuraminic acid mutarotase